MRGALGKLSGEQKKAQILLAYEPVWAIGDKGIPASSDYADARQGEILAVAEDMLGYRPLCLYGGSVNPGNCEELISSPISMACSLARPRGMWRAISDILANAPRSWMRPESSTRHLRHENAAPIF